tara:strand:- start:623 stop:1156 length:534 start_codon:yes stop_codon:yes gene_type:complete
MNEEEKEHKKRYGVIENEKGELETTHLIDSEDGKAYPVLKERVKIKKGKKSRAAGVRFEGQVRKYWEERGWAIDKWSNNVNLEENKMTIAKRKYNPFKKVMAIGTGFPDFIGIKFIRKGIYNVIGIEVKVNGLLSKEEKQKCQWYLDNNTFSEILIAKKGKKRGEIEYIDFKEKWGN